MKLRVASRLVNVELDLPENATVGDLKKEIYKRCTRAVKRWEESARSTAERSPLGRPRHVVACAPPRRAAPRLQTAASRRSASGSPSTAGVRRRPRGPAACLVERRVLTLPAR